MRTHYGLALNHNCPFCPPNSLPHATAPTPSQIEWRTTYVWKPYYLGLGDQIHISMSSTRPGYDAYRCRDGDLYYDTSTHCQTNARERGQIA